MPFPELRASRFALLIASILVLVGCKIQPPKPPVPPPPPQPIYYFDLATIPRAACRVTIEGYAKGPQVTADGYVYVDGYQSSIGAGAVMFECPGYLTQIWTSQVWAQLQDNNTLGGHNFYTLAPVKPEMPHVPTKGELLRAQHTFQGLRANCPEYDTRPLPIFDVMIDTVGDACLQSIENAHRAAGDKIIAIALSHAYLEPGIEAPISTGHDWTYDLPGLNAFITRLVIDGFYVQLHLAGDGGSLSKNGDGSWRYNDPVGWTYGYEFIRDFFPTLNACLHGLGGCGQDVHGYVRLINGFDGVFYGWSPEQAVAFAAEVKNMCADCVLGIEFNVGHIPFGEGGEDYLAGGRMSLYDLLLGEFPRPLTGDDVWQIIARLVPHYQRPIDQPAGDDPSPPFYLRVWPGVFSCWEWGIYYDVRFQTTPGDIEKDRQFLRWLGCPVVG